MRSYADLIHRSWEEDRLFSVLIELGYQCPLNCRFCYNDRSVRGKLLSRRQYLQLFSKLSDLGVLYLSFSGGEPTAHPDFFSLGAAARREGFVLRIKSSGFGLKGEMARRIRDEIDPFVVELSLHGASAATQDFQTRRPGSFDSLMETIDDFKTLGQRVELRCTLTRINEDELDEIFCLAEKLELPLIIDPDISPRDNGDRAPLELGADDGAIRRLFERQREGAGWRDASEQPISCAHDASGCAGRLRTRYCGAGTSSLLIDPFGEVFPCVQWRKKLGNLHEQTIFEIWENSPTLRDLRRANEAAWTRVAGIPNGAMLAFCPGLAESESGHPDEIYDRAWRRRAIALSVFEGNRAPQENEAPTVAQRRPFPTGRTEVGKVQ